MSPPRRRSSRLAAVSAKVCLLTPPFRTNSDSLNSQAKSTPELPSVTEADNADKPAGPPSHEQTRNDEKPPPAPVTPKTSRLQPSHEDMHPSKCQSTMAPEPSSALRLGFTDIRPSNVNVPGAALDTPTRIRNVPATEFTFRFARGAPDVPLSENAQRLMNELREHANKIKADMRAQREASGESGLERPIAQPKGKAGRFSAAHMAEFKKMDSIEGHASVWRASRTTPVKTGLKRSPSKADLDGTPTSTKLSLKRSPSKAELDGTPKSTKPSLKRTISKANLGGTPQSQAKSGLKRSSSRAKLDDGDSTQPDEVNFSVSGRPRTTPVEEPQSSFTKRIKKSREDDASKSRPISRDGTSIPRPKTSGHGSGTLTHSSSLSRLTSRTKASQGHAATPTKPTISLVKSPSKPELGSLKRPAFASTVMSPSPSKATELRRRIISPGSFQKVKSILRGQKPDTEQARTALPKPAAMASQTPGPSRVVDKELPPLPLTTPRRRLVKHVAFTPDTKHAAEAQNTPSPQKFTHIKKTDPVQYPAMDGILTESTRDDVVYPDLSGLKDLTRSSPGDKRKDLPESIPGTFTFRSDHTIDFGAAPAAGFGASPGQASVRHIRPSSIGPRVNMPGSFPAPPSPSTHPNKENKEPAQTKVLPGVPHGLPNKKRHRAPSEEGDVEKEATDRAAKKRKNAHAPQKTPSAAAATRSVTSTPVSSVKKMQVGQTPSRTPGSASPTKKRAGLSMSRLNMLARPKNRA
ncbi:hypothetical protein ACRE_000590 [Hapsidospora chrysogenum ATCC 11550]|uniref:Erythromycin esterase n=1 Tax=Hapsidospora chrysogenum (strain ATCC 11550 / CBS 779.69 / DSM 880 / IAM 14645 / JCM 23072 / IMI 49137) TaxID=857340 RepID=A0A086THQ7_HAPC1|nr:hypothetical protein ACRE_000590 [Hapsidospora chrysogenum ATCC 11550]